MVRIPARSTCGETLFYIGNTYFEFGSRHCFSFRFIESAISLHAEGERIPLPLLLR